MPRPSRLGLALAAAVAASSLFVGGGLAAAEPGPNSPECTAAKSAEATAKTAAEASGATEAAKSAYTQAQQATKTACTAKEATSQSTSPTSTSTSKPKAPDQNGRPPNGGGGGRGDGDGRGGDRNNDGRDDDDQDGPGDDKDCDDFMSQREAQAYYDGAKRPGDDDPSNLDKDDDGKACESLADVDGDRSKLPARIDVKVVIVQTDDDDSEAKVSGSQVKDVPEGSVDTGSAQ